MKRRVFAVLVTLALLSSFLVAALPVTADGPLPVTPPT
jgi:hypothetical protein